jgi:NAD(P)-dependent dehydrogenase (short-subunit alcohol dehydrogenase family)
MSPSSLLRVVQPNHIVYTAGVNDPGGTWDEHFAVNCVGAMNLLECWQGMCSSDEVETPFDGHYVAISSNSAHIARTGSGMYCASKAALSMALRVAAREAGRAGLPFSVYGYEPGLLKGTPMTEEVKARLGRGAIPLHRMVGVEADGISRQWLALQIVHNLRNDGRPLNGCLLRLDAGEQ